MEDNIINLPGVTMIVNGGDPLPGCPESWEEAKKIQASVNEDKDDWAEPVWKFDCGFKLDFDGPLLRLSSRFYPPKTHYGSTWDGRVSVFIFDKRVEERKFDCATLKELIQQVEAYKDELLQRITLRPL